MAKHGVRRLPVVDGTGKLVGILSLNDLATAAAKEPQQRLTAATAEAMRVLQAVCAHRQPIRSESAIAPMAPAAITSATPAAPMVIPVTEAARSQAQTQIGT